MLVEERGERRQRVAQPPDGGWGWAVVFASFMIHVIADGIAYSFGLFFVEISQEFGGNKSTASFIGSMLFGVTFGAGPVASAFVNRFGCRPVAIAGSIIAALGFGVSYWATSIAFLYVSVGLIGGLGLGLIYLPAIVCVSCYFEKRRAFATGIAVCGSGFGNFILALIMDPLIQKIGWRASMVVAAFIFLFCIVFGAMFRPLEDPVDDFPNPNYEMETEKMSNGATVHPQSDNYFLTQTGDTIASRGSHLSFEHMSPSHLGVNPKGSIEMMPIKYLREDNESGSISSLRRVDSLEEIALKTDSIMSESRHDVDGVDSVSSQHPRGVITSRKDVFYSGSVTQIPDLIPNERSVTAEDYPSRPGSSHYEHEQRGSRKCSVDGYGGRGGGGGGGDGGTNNCCVRLFSQEFYGGMKTMMDFSLLANPIFLYFAFSNFLTNVGYNVPYIYLADLAKDNLSVKENDPSLGIIVSSIGVTNTLSRLVLGYLSDKKCVNRLYLYSVALTICGIVTGLAAHGYSLAALVTCAGLFGATGGVYVGLTSVILVDLFGLDKLSNAFGIVLLFQGVGTLVGPPIVGCLFDQFKNYIFGFWLAGMTIAVSGSMLFLIPIMKIRLRRRGSRRQLNGHCGNSPYAISNENQHDSLIT